MKSISFVHRILSPIYYFVKYMILVYGICVIIALIIALGFHIVKGSSFDQIYFDALKGIGGVLIVGGALILFASTGGGMPPRTREGVILAGRDTGRIKEWKSDFVSRVVQGLFVFIYGLILEFLLYTFP